MSYMLPVKRKTSDDGGDVTVLVEFCGIPLLVTCLCWIRPMEDLSMRSKEKIIALTLHIGS